MAVDVPFGYDVANAMHKDNEAKSEELQEIAWRGIELCRLGSWDEGLYLLSQAMQDATAESSLPSQLYALLGYGLARFRNQQEQGLRLCRHAVEVGLYQPENYYYLARTWLTLADRRAAIDSLEKGLQIDSTDSALLALKRRLGDRRRPVLSSLPRNHVFNRILGRLRHGLLGGRQRRQDSGQDFSPGA